MAETPTKYQQCVCTAIWPDYEIFERDGKLYGPCCLRRSAERRAQEHWAEQQEKP